MKKQPLCDTLKGIKDEKANKKMSDQLIYTKSKRYFIIAGKADILIKKSVYKDQAVMLNGLAKTIEGKVCSNNRISSLILKKWMLRVWRLNIIYFEYRANKKGYHHSFGGCSSWRRFFLNVLALKEGFESGNLIVNFTTRIMIGWSIHQPSGSIVLTLNIANDEQIAYIKEESASYQWVAEDWFTNWLTSNWNLVLIRMARLSWQIILLNNCRLWDAGNHIDKDVFRRDLGSLTDVYKVVLEKLQSLK